MIKIEETKNSSMLLIIRSCREIEKHLKESTKNEYGWKFEITELLSIIETESNSWIKDDINEPKYSTGMSDIDENLIFIGDNIKTKEGLSGVVKHGSYIQMGADLNNNKRYGFYINEHYGFNQKDIYTFKIKKMNHKNKKAIHLKEINKWYCTWCEALHSNKEDAKKCCD